MKCFKDIMADNKVSYCTISVILILSAVAVLMCGALILEQKRTSCDSLSVSHQYVKDGSVSSSYYD